MRVQQVHGKTVLRRAFKLNSTTLSGKSNLLSPHGLAWRCKATIQRKTSSGQSGDICQTSAYEVYDWLMNTVFHFFLS